MNWFPAVAVALSSVFGDNMVLQRNARVPVWGTARPGEHVVVVFAGQRQETAADGAGRWSAVLNPLVESSQPRTLSVNEIRLTNVVVGDVWVAAGQSNMEFPLRREAHAAQELPAARDEALRLCNWAFAGQGYGARRFGRDVIERLTPDGFYKGRWAPCTPETAADFSAVAYYFGREVRAARRIPVGVIHLAVGGSPAEAWIRREALPANLQPDPWCMKRMKENLGAAVVRHPFDAGFLWEAGIRRLIPFAIRGVLWYQGESNAETDWRVQQHAQLFPLLVRDWRQQWGQGDFPFLYVQLPGMERTNWPAFREQQRGFLQALPNLGMAVALDLGNPTDVHPTEKRELGRRLALLESGCGGSPLPRSASVRSGKVTVLFDQAGLKTRDGEPPRCVELADRNGVFREAPASLRGRELIVEGTGTAVRYAWKPYCPEANLVGEGGLPAPTFVLPVEGRPR